MHIHCVLGKVASASEGVTVVKEDLKDAIGNSNRWIFDIVAPYKDWLVELSLLDFRSSRPKPAGILVPKVTPLNAAAAQALIFFPDPDLIRMQIVLPANAPVSLELRFRVSVDGMHTLMR